MVMQLVVFFAWVLTHAPNVQFWLRRWFTLWTYGYALRATVVGLTLYYPPEFKDHTGFVSSNPFVGALLLAVQVKSSLTDLMFSGHTTTWVLSARFVYYHSVSNVFRMLYVVGAVIGPILLVAVREHYSADVVVAVIIAWLLFEVHYLWIDRHYRDRWLPVWQVEVQEPMRIVYPLSVTDAEGRVWVIGKERAGEVELVGSGVTPERKWLMDYLRWLDDDEIVRPLPQAKHLV